MNEQNSGKLNIIVAVYGLKTVTDLVKDLIIKGNPQTLSFIVNNKTIGEDGWIGQRKSIMVVYNYDGGNLHVAAAKEGDVLIVNPDQLSANKPALSDNLANKNGLSILAASYGPADVTDKVRELISTLNTLSFTVDNTTLDDTWYGVAKTLVIILGSGNEVTAVEVFVERETCYIDLNDTVPAI
jgi:hypothetical protein